MFAKVKASERLVLFEFVYLCLLHTFFVIPILIVTENDYFQTKKKYM